MYRIILSIFLLNLIINKGVAQLPEIFWKQTNSFPTNNNGNANLSIAIDTLTGNLLIGTDRDGIFISKDEGNSWRNVLLPEPLSPVYQIEYDNNGMVYAAVDGAVYRSEDYGDTWERFAINSSFPVTDIFITNNHYVFASTGGYVLEGGHEVYGGDGIYRSIDFGKTWIEVNNGVTGFKSVFHLAGDSKGRIFATLNESYTTGAGGILYSDDYGEWWHKFSNLSFETDPGERTTAIFREGLTLEVDRYDSIYVSYTGSTIPGPSGSSVGLSGNLKNSFEGAVTGQKWNHMRIRPSFYTWYYHPIYSLFFSSNGQDVFSSYELLNNTSIGGPYFSLNRGVTWTREPSGILPVNNSYMACYYVQNKRGRVFAIHKYDDAVYYTDKSSVTGVSHGKSFQYNIYPNPAYDFLYLDLPNNDDVTIDVQALTGLISKTWTYDDTGNIKIDITDLPKGIYILRIKNVKNIFVQKIVIE